ncbi:MAG: hypothetical protein IID16_10870 [Candidatus Marinimicrobia bacterium]|nr:hypothetical protein [Candidatus Neomarinimicrobiota bacterium]
MRQLFRSLPFPLPFLKLILKIVILPLATPPESDTQESRTDKSLLDYVSGFGGMRIIPKPGNSKLIQIQQPGTCPPPACRSGRQDIQI